MKAREREALERMIRQALEEDIGPGDITTNAVVSPDTVASGSILSKTGGVIAGLEFAKILFSIVDDRVEFTPLSEDGTCVHEGDVVAEVKGPVQHLLSSERVLLNFMQRMSGIATMTKAFVETIKGTKAVILDTRKTAPGLRVIDKWAVRIGGGQNHRLGLYDVAMIKENHIEIAGGLTEALRRVRDRRSEIRGQRSEIRGQKSAVGGRKSEIGSQTSGGSEVAGKRSLWRCERWMSFGRLFRLGLTRFFLIT